MTPLEMIAEWRKGCSCASKERPEDCPECTRALIDALEKKLRFVNSATLEAEESRKLRDINLVSMVDSGATLRNAAREAGIGEERARQIYKKVSGKTPPRQPLWRRDHSVPPKREYAALRTQLKKSGI